jgi:hypothetical protein
MQACVREAAACFMKPNPSENPRRRFPSHFVCRTSKMQVVRLEELKQLQEQVSQAPQQGWQPSLEAGQWVRTPCTRKYTYVSSDISQRSVQNILSSGVPIPSKHMNYYMNQVHCTVPMQFVHEFHTILRINSDYFLKRHLVFGSCIRGAVCFLWGKLCFTCVDLNSVSTHEKPRDILLQFNEIFHGIPK